MITLVSCWYNLKNKHSINQFESWICRFLKNVKKFNLVIFSDNGSHKMIQEHIKDNKLIKLILLEHTDFYNYKYKECWEKNHELIRKMNINHIKNIDWKVLMLWAEKISFVKYVVDNKIFDTEFYGWCDIGYFREGSKNITQKEIQEFPNYDIINGLSKNHIYYANTKNENVINTYSKSILDKNEYGLPKTPIDVNQVSIAGGFFLSYKQNIDWWRKTFDDTLNIYFKHNYVVKDDQYIILDCVCTHRTKFILIRESNPKYSEWFAFQHFLLK